MVDTERGAITASMDTPGERAAADGGLGTLLARAKRVLGELGMVDAQGAAAVRSVLNAAAWTYVAATLQSVLTVLYYVMQFTGGGRNE